MIWYKPGLKRWKQTTDRMRVYAPRYVLQQSLFSTGLYGLPCSPPVTVGWDDAAWLQQEAAVDFWRKRLARRDLDVSSHFESIWPSPDECDGRSTVCLCLFGLMNAKAEAVPSVAQTKHMENTKKLRWGRQLLSTLRTKLEYHILTSISRFSHHDGLDGDDHH